MDRWLGEESASQHPPLTEKSFPFVRARARAVPVRSSRQEKVCRRGCIFCLFPWEVVSFILWAYLIFGILAVVPQTSLFERVSQVRFPREISRRVSQERFPRGNSKRCFQERFPRDLFKRDFQESQYIFPREISKRGFREFPKGYFKESFPRDISNRYPRGNLREFPKRDFQYISSREISKRHFQDSFPRELSTRDSREIFPREMCKRYFQERITIVFRERSPR